MSAPATDADSTSTALDARIYDTLASVGERENTVEIEILPDGLGPLLTDGDGSSLGVTKKALVQAFTTARRAFFTSNPTSEDGSDDDVVVAAASTVILVFDSEHLTACNWRKRRIVRSLSKQGSDGADRPWSPTPPPPLLSIECNFTASLLGSPLHRHAKSPTLWYHRLWLMQVCLRHHQQQQQAKAGLLKREVELVLRAAEHHPMNYYAFSYLRQTLALLGGGGGGGGGLDDRSELVTTYEVDVKVEPEHGRGAGANAAVPETGVTTSRLISDTHLIITMRDWCLRNPGDNSGWMFLLHILTLVRDGGNDDEVHDVVQQVIRFGRAVQWQREALWTFVELAGSKFGVTRVEETESGLEGWYDRGQGHGQGPAALRLELEGPVANEIPANVPGPRSWKRWAQHLP
ncbi:conserved hypothetical protein [Trichophyton verrucosum HKI 0517]|uniref:Protein prenyltransferase n=1 Tax=Trichophyton verrucosum (strain HKI 0517) TaxID=663202 RepID=D4CZ04_TRIVH|nr:uncharacterized protein TRV_00041 [Trichophyton verrucosum HKI 0517]EFE45168.1 conserved hypothetical protein [Trichophyton verrucosum HKI 0517]